MNVVKPGMKFRRVQSSDEIQAGTVVTACRPVTDVDWYVRENKDLWSLAIKTYWEPVIESTALTQPWYVQHVASYDGDILNNMTDVIAKAVRAAIEKCAEQCDDVTGSEGEYRGSVECRKKILAMLGDK